MGRELRRYKIKEIRENYEEIKKNESCEIVKLRKFRK